MNEAKIKKLTRGLSSAAAKVYAHVPAQEIWTTHRIVQHLQDNNHGMSVRIIQGCLYSLKDDGLVVEVTKGAWRKVVAKPKLESVPTPKNPVITTDTADEMIQQKIEEFNEQSRTVKEEPVAIKRKPNTTTISKLDAAKVMVFVDEHKDDGTFTNLRMREILALMKDKFNIEVNSTTMNNYLRQSNVDYIKTPPTSGVTTAVLTSRVAKLERMLMSICKELGIDACDDIGE